MKKLGHGGMHYICKLFRRDPETIRQRAQDIKQLPANGAASRVGKKGDRKKASIAMPALVPTIEKVMALETAVRTGRRRPPRDLGICPEKIHHVLREGVSLSRRHAIR